MKTLFVTVMAVILISALLLSGVACTEAAHIMPTPTLTPSTSPTPAATPTPTPAPTPTPLPTPKPSISFSPSFLSFTATAGGANPPAQAISIWNSGGGTLYWAVNDFYTWLDLSYPRAGSSTGGMSNILVSVGISGLSAGTYQGYVIIDAPLASNNSQSIPVNLTINPAPTSPPKTVSTTWTVTWRTLTGSLQWGGQIGSSEFPSTFDYNWGSGAVYDGYSDYIGINSAWAEINMQRPGGGPVQFTVGSDDGALLYLDGNLIIDNWGNHSYRTKSVTVNVVPGEHMLWLYYEEITDVARLSFTCDSDVLQWQEPAS